MKKLRIEAAPVNVEKVIEFIDEVLEENGCGMREQMAISVAVDELFANISHYAYAPETGMAEVWAEVAGDPPEARISFIDSGKPFNPLALDEPETGGTLEEREIGGMGIHIVKNSMDGVEYEYTDGKNKLTIIKKI